jgi:hypothetical protein
MQSILSLRCIFDTARQCWAIELTLGGESTHRFPISPDQIEPFLEAFDDCSKAEFDPASREVVFAFEYEDEEDDEDDEEKSEADEEEDAKAAEEKGMRGAKGQSRKAPTTAGKHRSR